MSNNLIRRNVRDIDDTVLTYAEIKALSVGDPLLKTRIETSNELERLKIHCRQREQELKTMESVVSSLPATLAKLEERKQRLEQDYQHFVTHRESLSRDDRNAFGEEALDALKGNFYVETEEGFDEILKFISPDGTDDEILFKFCSMVGVVASAAKLVPIFNNRSQLDRFIENYRKDNYSLMDECDIDADVEVFEREWMNYEKGKEMSYKCEFSYSEELYSEEDDCEELNVLCSEELGFLKKVKQKYVQRATLPKRNEKSMM